MFTGLSPRRAFVRSHLDVGQPGSAFQFIPKVFCQVEVRTLCRSVKFFLTRLAHPCLSGSCFVHFVPFTAPNGPSPTPEKHHKSLLHQTLHLAAQPGKYRCPGIHQSQTRPSDCQREKRDWSLQRTRLYCSRIQWLRLYTAVYDTLHCARWCKACVQLVAMETHSTNTSMHALFMTLQKAGNLCAAQHPLTPVWDFMWPTTSRLSCCCSHSLSHCYRTANTWLRNNLYIISAI